MERFSAKRLLVNVLLLLMAVFMVVAGISRFSSFLKAYSVEVVNEKVASYPVYEEEDGNVFFISSPVISPASGTIDRLSGNFSYVKKNQIIGKIKDSDYTVDILSPAEGVLLWGKFDRYYSSVEEIKGSCTEECGFTFTSENIKKGEIVCSVLNNDSVFVALPSKEKSIFIYGNGFTIKGLLRYTGEKLSLYEFYQYAKYFINKKSYLVLKDSKKGIKIRDNMLIMKGATEGVYIVSGNIIRFVPVVSYPMEKGYRLAVGNFGTNSVIVVSTPHLVRDGEIFNE